MNIRTDYLNELQRQEETKKTSKPIQSSGAFEELLSQEIATTSTTQINSNDISMVFTGKLNNIDPTVLMALNKPEMIGALGDTTLDSVTKQTDALLLSWDEYSAALEGGASARGAWEKLTKIEAQIKKLQGNLASMQSPNSNLESIANELNIMTIVEKAKINRGDYTL